MRREETYPGHVWMYDNYIKDFTQIEDSDPPDPSYGTYPTLRAAQFGRIREQLKGSGGVLTPAATAIVIDLLEELFEGT